YRVHGARARKPQARTGREGLQHGIGRLAQGVIVHEPAFSRFVPGASVVPHGLETVAERPTRRDLARHSLGLDERLVALCFGFIAPYKGLELALEAATLASGDVQLVVAGDEHPRLKGRDTYAADLRARWP